MPEPTCLPIKADKSSLLDAWRPFDSLRRDIDRRGECGSSAQAAKDAAQTAIANGIAQTIKQGTIGIIRAGLFARRSWRRSRCCIDAVGHARPASQRR